MDAFCYVIIFFFFLLSYASSPLSCASPASFSRRHLLQAPLTDPSTFTPPGSPFFPLYGSSSPPPPTLPPPATNFATFPANISALVLPRSPKSQTASHTLLITAISAVVSVAIVIGLAMFLYGRWRGQTRHFKDDSKSSASDISQPQRHTTENKHSVTTSTSDVLYIGNVVTSVSSFVKPESPEIRPLPPLPARSFLQEANPHTDGEEEEEEDDFYSPLASQAGQESHNRRNNPYSNYSSSSPSTSDSPAMSPPVTISPAIQNPKVTNNKRNVPSLRMFSLWNQNLGFPRISSASTSPERGTIRTPDAYARSSMYSSVSTTPDRFFRKVLESSPPRWNEFSRNVKSLFLSSTSASPARDFCINISESSRHLKSSWENSELEQSDSAPPPPHPPPQRPPPEISEPPPLVPPSQSYMVKKSGKKLSFSELPQTCWESKPKLKPLPWDKVRPTSGRKTSWDRFPLNSGNTNLKQRSLSCDFPMLNQETRTSDPRKCQNIGSLLTTHKLTTNDVLQALQDGHYEELGIELLESLSRMAPSEEVEKKLRSYNDDSIIKLTQSERFLKDLLTVPFVFKRVDALLSIANFDFNLEYLKKSFSCIQAACEELQNSKELLKLIEAVLKTKNSTAHVFKLETLLGKTTLLHSIIQNIIETEGTKELEAVRNLSSVLVNVKKTAEMDYGVLRNDMSKLYKEVEKVREVLLLSEENEEWWRFRQSMIRFLGTAEEEIKKIETQEGYVVCGVKEMTKCFHGDSSPQILRVFVILRDFLSVLDKVCKEIMD